MALVGVASTSRAFREGMAQQGATLLGGDLSLEPGARRAGQGRDRLSRRARKTEPDHGSPRHGAARRTRRRPRWSRSRRWMPPIRLIGAAKTDPAPAGGQKLSEFFAERDGAFGLLADPALGARLNVKLGDQLVLGAARFTLAGWLTSEPDSIGGVGFGPRVMMSPARSGGDWADCSRLAGSHLAAPAAAAGKIRRRGCRRRPTRLYRRLSRCGLRDSQSRQSFAAAFAQYRAFRAIPDPDRPDGAGLRRRRRRQFHSRPDRPKKARPWPF